MRIWETNNWKLICVLGIRRFRSSRKIKLQSWNHMINSKIIGEFKNPGSMDPIARKKIQQGSPNWVRGGFAVFCGLVRVPLVLIEPYPDFIFFDIHFSTPVKWFNGPIMVILKIPPFFVFPIFAECPNFRIFDGSFFPIQLILRFLPILRILWFFGESFALGWLSDFLVLREIIFATQLIDSTRRRKMTKMFLVDTLNLEHFD